jgi:hypothetical protein
VADLRASLARPLAERPGARGTGATGLPANESDLLQPAQGALVATEQASDTEAIYGLLREAFEYLAERDRIAAVAKP